jgi:hypothetical protein
MSRKVKSKRKKFATLAREGGPGHPDLRTKAGRAWKAKQAEKARRARNRAADEQALDAFRGETRALGPFNPKDSIVVEPLSEAFKEMLREACPERPHHPYQPFIKPEVGRLSCAESNLLPPPAPTPAQNLSWFASRSEAYSRVGV